jgi:DNA-binding response OmpR family regulator
MTIQETTYAAMPSQQVGIDLDEIRNSSRHAVLVVEDEPDTVFLLKQILRMAGYNVLSAANGFEAIQKCQETRPDLVLLDLMMPQMDGWETYSHLREISDMPVIIISAIHNKDEVVRALRLGMDDYITKPFVNAEVVARVQAVLRRAKPTREVDRMVFPHPGLIIDLTTQEVILEDKRVQLTGKEFAILSTLARHAPDVVQYQVIAETVWGKDTPQVRNRIKYLVYLLRQKLEQVSGDPDLISNVDRLGYKLQVGS